MVSVWIIIRLRALTQTGVGGARMVAGVVGQAIMALPHVDRKPHNVHPQENGDALA